MSQPAYNLVTVEERVSVDFEKPDAADADAHARFAALVSQYGRLIRSVVRRVARGRSAEIGDDVEQRILTRLWKLLSRDAVIEHPSSYVFRAAVRETIRVLREEEARAGLPLAVDPAASRTDDPHRVLEAKELGEILQRELDALSPDRALALRFHLEGFTVHEIMELCGWTYNQARNLVSRGMTDLRRGLEKRGIYA